jgi:hypothetical protein
MTKDNPESQRSRGWLETTKSVLDVIKGAKDAWPLLATAAVYIVGQLAHVWRTIPLLETILIVALILAVLFVIVFAQRARRNTVLLQAAEQQLRQIADAERERERRRTASDSGLPALPNPAIQHGFAIWAIRFVTDLRPPKPTLTVALLGINYGDAEVTISKVAIPNFYLSSTSRSVDLRNELVRDEMLRIPAGQHFQFFVTKRLDAELVGDFAALARHAEYSASVSIEAHCRRESDLFAYAVSTSTTGIIHRPDSVAFGNSELAMIALTSGVQGPNIQRLIENGELQQLLDLLADVRSKAPKPALSPELLRLGQALESTAPGLLKALGWDNADQA